MSTINKATIRDLYSVPENGKAELVGGKIVRIGPTGVMPGRVRGTIYISLRQYEGTIPGLAHSSNVAFLVDLAPRRSFSPDASFHTSDEIAMTFAEGAPIFAAEVRSEGDYGSAAESEMAAKRADYFAAGTQVVWDVDMLGDDTVRSYSAAQPNRPIVFRRGDVAHAEPALPGWRLAVEELFR